MGRDGALRRPRRVPAAQRGTSFARWAPEPFRPLVDLFVSKHVMPDDDELRPKDKVALVGLLNADVGMPRGKMSVLSAIEQTIESLARVYDGGSETLLELPVLIGLEQHRLEC